MIHFRLLEKSNVAMPRGTEVSSGTKEGPREAMSLWMAEPKEERDHPKGASHYEKKSTLAPNLWEPQCLRISWAKEIKRV